MFSGCGKKAYFTLSDEERLEGIWTFDQVKFRKAGSLSRKDVSNDFRLSAIEFKLDGSFNYSDYANQSMHSGVWELVSYYQYDEEDEQDEKINDLYLDFLDSNGYLIETRYWPDFSSRKNKICIEEENILGKYWIDLIRVKKK